MTAALVSAPQPNSADPGTAGVVLFLAADTGGGHRAAAGALVEGFGRE
jgi:hypothetical protein